MRIKKIQAALLALGLGLAQVVQAAPPDIVTAKKPDNNEIVGNKFWWPDSLDLSPLRHSEASSNPLGPKFDYAVEFKKLDLSEVKKDIVKVMTTSQDWWPADYGNYGPFFIRMAWHSAGTYRIADGRGGGDGGQQRFEPLNSWPDNASLDKARRLLWPVKEKYGQRLSWGDLMVLAGTVAMENMGFQTIGFAGGRVDDWQADVVYWGPEHKFMEKQDKRFSKEDHKLEKPLGAAQMGLIYVNPEGPNQNPDPTLAAGEIRQTFARMAMNDEETVALIAGGHTFGKAHGASKEPGKCLGPEPAASGVEKQGFGWENKCGTGVGKDATTSGLEGAWSSSPTHFTMQYLTNLFGFDWVLTKSPSGAHQWVPKDGQAATLVPDAHDPNVRHAPMMFTTDIAIKTDPKYREIAKRFLDNPKEFEAAFARTWFKLTHRDMGPRSRYLGSIAPKDAFLWQDAVPAANRKELIGSSEIASLKKKILGSGVSQTELIRTAWASASSFRSTDMRGGANGARLRLTPQKDWAVNNPQTLAKNLEKLEQVQKDFNKSSHAKKVSLADVIVLGGCAAVEQAAKAGGFNVKVPFTPGRTDATVEQTDVMADQWLEPKADAFRNYYSEDYVLSPTVALVDRASTLSLTAPEMTVLVGGLRSLNANADGSANGVFTTKPGVLSNDFFTNLLDMSTKWQKSSKNEGLYEGVDRKTGAVKWTATPVDLIFGSQSELRAVAEVYASNDSKQKFAQDFVNAWDKVMMLDRFELKH